MPARTYTGEQRHTALAVYAEHGAAEAARQTGIPRGTISAWASRQHPADPGDTAAMERRAQLADAHEVQRLTLTQRRALLADLLLAEAERCVRDARRPYMVHSWKDGQIVTGTLPKPPALERQRLISAAGDAVERAQLLTGGATSRPELLADPAERRVRVGRLRDEVAERRRLRDGGEPVDGADVVADA